MYRESQTIDHLAVTIFWQNKSVKLTFVDSGPAARPDVTRAGASPHGVTPDLPVRMSCDQIQKARLVSRQALHRHGSKSGTAKEAVQPLWFSEKVFALRPDCMYTEVQDVDTPPGFSAQHLRCRWKPMTGQEKKVESSWSGSSRTPGNGAITCVAYHS